MLVAIFHANNGIISSSWLARIHESLDILTVISDQVGWQTNVDKTVGMTFQMCCMTGQHYKDNL